MATIFQPGASLTPDTFANADGSGLEDARARADAAGGLVDRLLNIVPTNPIEALASGNILQIIFFAIMGEENKSGEKRDAYRAALAERGLISGYVTVDTYDWHLQRLWSQAVLDDRDVDMDALSALYVDMVVDAAEHYDALGQRVLGRRPVQVLLLHDTPCSKIPDSARRLPFGESD